MDALESVVDAPESAVDALESVLAALDGVVDALDSVVDAADSVDEALESVDDSLASSTYARALQNQSYLSLCYGISLIYWSQQHLGAYLWDSTTTASFRSRLIAS